CLCVEDEGCPACHTLLGIEVVSRDVYSFYGFSWRHVLGMVRQPDENAGRPVDLGDVIVTVHAIDVDAQGALGGAAHRVLELPGRGAGGEVDEALIIPIDGQWEVYHRVGGQLDVDVSLLGLQGERRSLHGDLLGDLPE